MFPVVANCVNCNVMIAATREPTDVCKHPVDKHCLN